MRTTQTLIYRIGRRWHWRIISAYDDSELARGSAPRVSECRQQAQIKHQKLRTQPYDNHRRN